MNIQKYLGPDGQSTHYSFLATVIAYDSKQWPSRLEAAILASAVRSVADIEIVAGRIVVNHTMLKIYLFFDRELHTADGAIIHLTSFCNVLGAHGFSTCASACNLNFINA